MMENFSKITTFGKKRIKKNVLVSYQKKP